MSPITVSGQGRGVGAGGLLRVRWADLVRSGERRASREVTYRVGARGGRAMGELDQDVLRLAALHGFR